ncbi:DUF695 domain-containing protein [Rhizobium laguerreae]|uniref:DUF695 domain-containing protein n=1 Tax=Rhizobium laguerreae TaxID=1076926 RepID=UPI0014790005|nr:DUF695 domain-containing protein [Rhizobium laguerreae]NNG72942.1 DUF695 domain-containing protein [Rhizobium laguerreae]
MDGGDWSVYISVDIASPAAIAVDLQYRQVERIPSYPMLLTVELKLQHPRENGLPQKDESEIIYALEDRLVSQSDSVGNIRFVGHKLSDGLATYFFYASNASAMRGIIETARKQFPSYVIDQHVIQDTSWSVYRHVLAPSGDNLQQAEDNKVIQKLTSLGDDINLPRLIHHFAYFSTPTELQNFKAAILADGFHVDNETTSDQVDGKLPIRFSRRDAPSEITSVTVKLTHLAGEFSGDYDGWESPPAKGIPTP